MTTSEVARYFRVSVATVRRWASDGILAARRLPGGRAIRFERADVEALEQKRTPEEGA